MANKTWKDSSAVWSLVAGDWDPSAPANGDSALVPKVSAGLTSGFTALGAINLLDLQLGKDVRGLLGTSSNPLTFGACTGVFDINSPFAKEIHLAPTSVPDVVVRGTGNDKYALHLKSGTYARIKINTEGRVVIGAACIITDRIVMNRGHLLIEPGVTLTGVDIEHNGGVIENNAAVPGTIYGMSGTFNHVGDPSVVAAAVNIGNIRAMSGWLGDIRMKTTITRIAGHGGRVNLNHDSRPKTVTTAYAFRGSVIDATGGHIAFTNAPEELGGHIFGASNVKQIFDMEA